MKRIEFNPNLIPVITGLTLAVSCEWDKEKILEICADALTDANGHGGGTAIAPNVGAKESREG